METILKIYSAIKRFDNRRIEGTDLYRAISKTNKVFLLAETIDISILETMNVLANEENNILDSSLEENLVYSFRDFVEINI